MNVRMKDIAKDLGISVITVSKALRNHPDVAKETRERILKRVQELDYQPNMLARSLVTGHSYLIGLVVPGLMHPFFAEIASSLSAVVGRSGYSVILSSSEQDPQLEERQIRHLLARRLDALAVATSGLSTGIFEQINRAGMPYVLIDQELPGLAANFVGMDDVEIGRMATEHLIEQGCRRIAHLKGKNSITGIRRYEGYRKALERHGMEYDESLVIACAKTDTDHLSEGAEAMKQLLRLPQRPDALFCYNDSLAIDAMNVISAAGLSIPEEIAVIGCGNLYYDESLRVPLSSIDQNSKSIGEKTAEILLDLIDTKNSAHTRSVILTPQILVRASSQRKALSGK
ncbi:LacI family DNA-binding transcriptional regulator [Telmatobacter bradus]|uniref:LacI family DNA-binding transcriptional regulator n=1 Tax=Telmatobacter bradus TaxID=474953 RepID=UPI003B4367A5